MIERHASPQAKPGENKLSYPVPNPRDLVVVEFVDQKPQHYSAIELDSPHPENSRLGLDLRLVWQGPSSADPDKMVRVYANPRANQNSYNYAIKYSGQSNAAPIYLRSYLERRDSYVPKDKGKPLDGVFAVRILNPGVGYNGELKVDIASPTDPTGRCATAVATCGDDGQVKSIRVTDEGTKYVEAPLIYINALNGSGSGATAQAFIQRQDAVLVEEEAEKLTEEIPEIFNAWTKEMLGGLFFRVTRVYETLPGPWVPSSRWDDNHGAVSIRKRFVLTESPPQLADASQFGQTTYEAREGSSIVSVQTSESWGDEPYDYEFSVEIPDRVPPEFQDIVPLRKSGLTEVGKAELPTLGIGELARTSKEVDQFWRHETVTARDITQLPKTKTDYMLDGVRAGGAEFGGVFQEEKTLTADPMGLPVEQGFLITESSVENLGAGLTLRKTKSLFEASAASLLLTYPGSGFVQAPIVVFDEIDGGAGQGAAGTAVLSSNSTSPDDDLGGVFNRAFSEFGDQNGVFFFLGARYNGGIWTNPAASGVIDLTSSGNPQYPVSEAQLNLLVDRNNDQKVMVIVEPNGGGHSITFRLQGDRVLKANKITIRQASTLQNIVRMTRLRVQGTSDGAVWHDISGEVPISQTANGWTQGTLNNTVGYKSFRIFGLDGRINDQDYLWPALVLAEVEFYGELTIPFTGSPPAESFSVTGVTMTDGGENYAESPNVVFVPTSGGSDAAGTAVIDSDGHVIRVDMTNHGFGYITPPTVEFHAANELGTGATAESIIDGQLQTIDIDDGGDGYEDPPDVLIDTGPGGLGSAGAATAVLGFPLASIPVTAHGDGGYYTNPGVNISPNPNGASAHTQRSYKLDSIDVDDPGNSYTSPPTVNIDAPTGADGVQATAHAVMGSGGTNPFSVAFDGSDDRITLPAGLLDMNSDFTFEAWVNPISFPSHSPIIGANNGGSDYWIILDRTDADGLCLQYDIGGGGQFRDSGYFLAFSTWTHIALTRTGNSWQWYINGVAQNSFTDSVGVLNTSAAVEFGAYASLFWHGGLDDVRIWNLARSGGQIAANMNNELTGSETGLVHYYKADEGSGTTLGDSAGSDDGTLVNGTAWDSDVPFSGGGTDTVASIVIDDPGFGYLTEPNVSLVGDGTDAAASANLEASGYVDSVIIDDPGLFETAPTASLTGGGGGTGATLGTPTIETAGSILRIDIDNVGTNYQGGPGITFDTNGGPGTGAAATAHVLGDLTAINVTAGGTNYQEAPLVQIQGDATATATISGGAVTAVNITDNGSPYSERPSVLLVAQGGPQAVATIAFGINNILVTSSGRLVTDGVNPLNNDTVTIGSKVYTFKTTLTGSEGQVKIAADAGLTMINLISAINHTGTPGVDYFCAAAHTQVRADPVVIDSIVTMIATVTSTIASTDTSSHLSWANGTTFTNGGGSGYLAPPQVTIEGNGRSASAYSVLGRALSRVEVVAPGDNYGPTVHAGASSNQGTGATLTVQRSFGIASTTISNGGSNYTSDPLVTAPSPEGTDAIFQAFRGLPMKEVSLFNGGRDYATPPTVTFPPPISGSTATGDAILGFGVEDVTMDNMGTGYLSAPHVELRAVNGGSGATAIAELLGRTVASILVDIGGSGYTSPPTIIIGDGSGAQAHAVLTGDVITSIVIDDPGSGYLVAPPIYIGNDGGGTGAHAVATLSAGQDIRIVVTNSGSGYEDPPDVIITLGGGSGAAATANLKSTGSVKRVEMTAFGTGYITDVVLAFAGGGGTGAAGNGVRDIAATGPIAAISVLSPGAGYVATTINLIFTGGGGTGAAGTAVKKTLGRIKSITVTNGGSNYEDPPIIVIGEANLSDIGDGAIGRGILATTGRVKRVTMTSAGEGFTLPPRIRFPATDGINAAAAAFLKSTGSIETLTLTVPGGPYRIAPLVSFLPPGDSPIATALYLLPQNYPTLYDEYTDPVDKFVVGVTKDLVPKGTILPPGFSESNDLNKWRRIQIVSKLDLHRLPPPEVWLTTQHVAFPDRLIGVLPVWNTRVAHSHSINGVHTLGSVSATAEISGTLVVLKKGGFRGAALARLERVFFNGIPPESSVPPVTIIRPSSGTAYIRGGANSESQSGSPGGVVNVDGGPAQVGDIIGYNDLGQAIVFQGYNTAGPDTSRGSSISSSIQVVDINDVLTAGLVYSTVNGITQDEGVGTPGFLSVHAAIDGQFAVNIPASCPDILPVGMTILQEVAIEKRRFNIYVRHIMYVIAPDECRPVGQYGPGPS